MNQPKCKHCGKKLTDPVSIACGAGPECRGDSPKGKKAMVAHVRKSRGQAYQAFQGFSISNNAVTFQPTEDGRWQDDKGRISTHEQLGKYLKTYQFI